MDPQFSVDYMFDFFGRLHHVSQDKLQARKEELFSYFEIRDFAHKKIKELPTGMGQKAAIVVCLVHAPDIVIFDVTPQLIIFSMFSITTGRGWRMYLISSKCSVNIFLSMCMELL